MLNQDIVKLNLESFLVKKLNSNQINQINDLWKLKRNDLKKMGFNDNEITQIIIKMQLQGLDLNYKVYKNH